MHMTVYKCLSVDVFGTKARMDTYRILSSLDRVEWLMFQNLLEAARIFNSIAPCICPIS